VRLFAALVVAAVAVGDASAAAPAVKRTKADDAAARATLLTSADLGKEWKVTRATSQQAPGFSCSGYEPSGRGIVETGAATSPSFSSNGAIVQQNTGVYATAKQARAFWARAIRPGLAACAGQTLASIESRGIVVSNLAAGTLPLAKPVPRTAAYRVTATLKANGKTLKTYYDVLIVSRGRTITEITISTFGNPAPQAFEHALAVIVARRLGTPSA